MAWYSALALYFLFWVFAFFLVLPFGVRTSEEAGEELVPGQAESAPARVSMPRKLLWTTLVSAALFGLFMANWSMGWITRDEFLAVMPGPR